MTSHDYLLERFPALAGRLRRERIGSLPTPAEPVDVLIGESRHCIGVKYDNLTSHLYGGNKVRKLEYLFAEARRRDKTRIATFGAVGSNHALATALHARATGLECTCFLSHQAAAPTVAPTLMQHLNIGTELVRYGGVYQKRIKTLRRFLWGRNAWVIPMGGTSWLGTVGFVTAGLELAAQIEARDVPRPDRIYVGAGTMGTAVGLALGLSLAGIDAEIHAVRVSDVAITNRRAMQRLARKTAFMLRRAGAGLAPGIEDELRLVLRDEFFGPGYARTTRETEAAVRFGHSQLGLQLEGTYTGKTLAALIADLTHESGFNALYWHTYNSSPLSLAEAGSPDRSALPDEFEKYLPGNSP